MVIVFDLDDTIYNEIDFVTSGFRAVSSLFPTIDHAFEQLLSIFKANGSGKVFNQFLDLNHSSVPVAKCIETYKYHTPDLTLSNDVRDTLSKLSNQYPTGLLTDGDPITQKNKFAALGLSKYIQFPIFSGDYNRSKPDEFLFNLFHQQFPKEKNFFYIGDNPKKDFFTPNKFGWTSIQILNPVGIYRDVQPIGEYCPKKTLNKFNDLIEFSQTFSS